LSGIVLSRQATTPTRGDSGDRLAFGMPSTTHDCTANDFLYFGAMALQKCHLVTRIEATANSLEKDCSPKHTDMGPLPDHATKNESLQ
jgi:hypothetical protein